MKVNVKLENRVSANQRISEFRKIYPEYGIETYCEEFTDELARVTARICDPTGRVVSSGWCVRRRDQGQTGDTAYLSWAETISVSRAIAMMGILIEDGIASAEEMESVLLHEIEKEMAAFAADPFKYKPDNLPENWQAFVSMIQKSIRSNNALSHTKEKITAANQSAI